MKPVVFLDIDGVLVTQKMLAHRHPEHRCTRFDPECVTQLNRITDETEAGLVVSSSWRIWWPELINYVKIEGVTGLIKGRTPYLAGKPRGREIGEWIDKENFIGHFVILDDDSDMMDLAKYHLHTSMTTGLTEKIASLAIERLQRTHA